MPLPNVLAKSTFHLIYTAMRLREGAKYPLIRRKVRPVDDVRKQLFDKFLEKAMASDPRVSMDYDLPYPKHEFLN